MITGEQFEQFVAWQKAGKRRAVDISLGETGSENDFKVWVYDYDLSTGQHVSDVSEIDLIGKKKRDLQTAIWELEQLEGVEDNATVKAG